MLLQCREVIFDRVVDTDIMDVKTGALQHHGHQIFTDIVNVAFNGANNHSTHRFCAGLCEQRPQNCHAALHGIGGQ